MLLSLFKTLFLVIEANSIVVSILQFFWPILKHYGAASQGLKFRDVGNKTLLKKEFAVNGSCIKNLKMGVQSEMLEKSRFWTIFCECYNLDLVQLRGVYDEI